MTSKVSKPRRIVYINGYGYGNYQIQEQRKVLFFSRWKGTHVCTSLEHAKSLMKYLNSRPEFGEVIVPYSNE